VQLLQQDIQFRMSCRTLSDDQLAGFRIFRHRQNGAMRVIYSVDKS
jgi:hypothetical protein